MLKINYFIDELYKTVIQVKDRGKWWQMTLHNSFLSVGRRLVVVFSYTSCGAARHFWGWNAKWNGVYNRIPYKERIHTRLNLSKIFWHSLVENFLESRAYFRDFAIKPLVRRKMQHKIMNAKCKMQNKNIPCSPENSLQDCVKISLISLGEYVSFPC